MAARASRIATTIGAIALATLLASCAPAVDVDEESVGASTTPTPSPSPEPTPTREPTTFTTQNGTASFALPDGWTTVDDSTLTGYDGQMRWMNVVQLVDADGDVRATYADGHGGDVGAAAEIGIVRTVPMAGETTAAAWWSHAPEGGWWSASAAAIVDLDEPFVIVQAPDERRLLSFVADLASTPECAEVVDEASAVACLESPETTETLEVIATLELADVPWDAMPEGVDPIADAPWVEHTTADGVLTFSYPASWTLRTHETVPGGLDRSFVTLVTPDGYQALDIRTSSASGPWVCDPERPDPTAQSITVLSGEPVAPFEHASIDPGGSIELSTFDFGGGVTGVALLHASDAANGCYDPSLLAGSGSIWVSSPWFTDMQGLIYDRYPGGVGFVGSYEHDVMLEVARSVAVHF